MRRIGILLGGLLVTIGLMVGSYPAMAQSGNLLQNGNFEGGFYDAGVRGNLPNGWLGWWAPEGYDPDPCRTEPPNYNENSTPSRVHEGSVAASYWGVDLGYTAGLYQEVNATSGTNYRLTAWGYSWSAADRETATSDDFTLMRVGIDTNGGIDPFSDDIVWSSEQFPMDNYAQLAVEATATGGKVTVFLWAAPNWCNPRNDTYWDDVVLTAVGTAPEEEEEEEEEEAPDPTQPPSQGGSSGVPVGSIPVSTPGPDGRVVHEVSSGETLIGIVVSYDDVYDNVTLERLRELNDLTSDTIRVGQELVIAEGQSGGGGGEPEAEPTEAPADEGEEEQPADSGGEGGEEQPAEDGGDDPEPTIVAEEPDASGTGTICVLIYNDVAGNAFRDPAEDALLPNATFAVSDGTETVATYTTDGASEPHCFTELATGSYTVSWVNDSYAATTEKTQMIELQAGDTVQREFGARDLTMASDDTDPAEGESEGGFLSDIPVIVTALVAAGGVIFLLGGIGIAAYFFIIRGNQKVA